MLSPCLYLLHDKLNFSVYINKLLLPNYQLLSKLAYLLLTVQTPGDLFVFESLL